MRESIGAQFGVKVLEYEEVGHRWMKGILWGKD